ncbi:MAG TPA: 8-oxoguanine deaminase [Caulobacteraceae bacterium]|nr:8-oxoguanine deaminase [Caulobacteraceae bacterium]
MSRSLFLKNADVVVTMDADRRELRGASIHVLGDRIAAIGTDLPTPGAVDEVIDLAGHLVCPGLVNTHHHMFQSLTRAIPAAQDASLFGWLQTLYPIWSRLTPEMVKVSTQTAMAELLLSGCTTSSDHLYLYPNGARLDDSIEGALEIGMRFHAARGAMSIGESDGGLPPDALVEREADILRDSQRVIDAFHDPGPRSMLRVALAPCSPFSVSRELMRDSAELARECGVSLHTHLAENADDVAYSLERFNCTPAHYAESLGWLGPDVWHAHCVQLDEEGVALFGRSRTGVAHCPCSNMRLGSGVAPITRMLKAGVPLGIGVDGSASNDSGDLLGELRQALLLQRVQHGPGALSARQALEMGTLGGAKVLGRDDVGALAPGMAADLAVFDLGALALAGALHDPVAALIFCAPLRSAYTIVNGRVVVREGRLETLDLRALIARHNRLAGQLVNG